MATIKEIAARANFSNTTVSRVLNNDKTFSVGTETRQKILDVAKEMGYKTLQERRKERQASEDISASKIGILLCHSVEEELNDAYFLSIRQGVEHECLERGLTTTELLRLTNLNSNGISSDINNLIVVGRINADILNQISDQLQNIVYINHTVDEDKYDSVVIDFEKATNRAIDHLLDLGYKKVGFIGGKEREHLNDSKVDFEDERKSTFKKTMIDRGLFNPKLFFVGEFTMADGYELMKSAIQQGDLPEALFIASDAMAIGAMRALQENQYRVPEDVAIVSFNDIELAQFASTPLTTVKVQTEEMGRLGVKLMVDRLKGREIPLKVTVPTALVVRDSCGAPHISNDVERKKGVVS
ncbi:LacI family DNA-binding transcriptional regulator [Halobacillus amylolyticus]|uniref:LacI family DNA-binding transcriptional regulator n=1 Tax=Halobacillus amylolyticus TaxID=2932259 RepID=A0ABY4H9K3_9BACI|nr:LacI family DNA-binding transcriptional regulator [Halobacillus amylolyticus]UOR11561.1 LacI family DNA-binding transcriptional regulator [Halobacillus amylolyticus]